MDVRLPDGTVIQGVPENITKAELVTKLKANGMPVPADWMADAPKPQASQQAGSALRQIPRQIGLAARYGMEGLGQVADVFAAPVRELVVNPLARLAGMPTARPLATEAASAATAAGLPSPVTADERVVGEATRTLAGGGGIIGAARGVAGATKGLMQTAANRMAAAPAVQAAGAAAAGASGGAVREAGGGPVEQFMAALVGGVAGGGAANAAAGAANRVRSALTPQAVKTAAADQQIALVLERQGVDWTQVPERIRQSVRQEVAGALETGSLNGDALRRILAFKNTGTTPTVGMLTQNPGQITREMNLAKTGANSLDPGLQRLPTLQNQNVAQLLRNLDDAGAARAPDAMGAGQAAVGSLRARQATEQGRINALYQQARDSGGRSLPLEGGTFTQRANALLDADNVGSFLPPDIANKMNAIATGKFPLTVDVAEQLKTSIGNLQRGSSDGNVRRALGLVRQALDDTPLQNSAKAGGAQLAIAGEVMPSVQAGEQSIAAFNAARSANRSWMQRIESNPALKAVVDGIEPDQFISRFVVGKGATAKDVGSLKGELDPQAVASIKAYLVRHLRDAATNSTDDIAKFSNDAYRRAMRDIGDDKLSLFFDKAELQKLKDVGEAAKLMQAQPAGSAVNNSNSGALVLGRGLDMLERAAGYVPLGGREIIKGSIQGRQQTQVLSPLNALMLPQPRQSVSPVASLAALAAPAQARDDDGRR